MSKIHSFILISIFFSYGFGLLTFHRLSENYEILTAHRIRLLNDYLRSYYRANNEALIEHIKKYNKSSLRENAAYYHELTAEGPYSRGMIFILRRCGLDAWGEPLYVSIFEQDQKEKEHIKVFLKSSGPNKILGDHDDFGHSFQVYFAKEKTALNWQEITDLENVELEKKKALYYFYATWTITPYMERQRELLQDPLILTYLNENSIASYYVDFTKTFNVRQREYYREKFKSEGVPNLVYCVGDEIHSKVIFGTATDVITFLERAKGAKEKESD